MHFKDPDRPERPGIMFTAMPTPTYDPFTRVTVMAGINSTGTFISADVTPADARAFAAEIIRSCEIVERENRPDWLGTSESRAAFFEERDGS